MGDDMTTTNIILTTAASNIPNYLNSDGTWAPMTGAGGSGASITTAPYTPQPASTTMYIPPTSRQAMDRMLNRIAGNLSKETGKSISLYFDVSVMDIKLLFAEHGSLPAILRQARIHPKVKNYEQAIDEILEQMVEEIMTTGIMTLLVDNGVNLISE
jgi:hypothetical protein